jgi:biopolymer transport protein ExbD
MGQGQTCIVSLNGVEIPYDLLDQVKLRALAKAHGNRVVIAADPKTTYRCVGGVIFSLQQAGFHIDAFIGNEVAVPAH